MKHPVAIILENYLNSISDLTSDSCGPSWKLYYLLRCAVCANEIDEVHFTRNCHHWDYPYVSCNACFLEEREKYPLDYLIIEHKINYSKPYKQRPGTYPY